MYFSSQQSASLVSKDVVTKSGRQVRRSIVEIDELQKVIDAARAQGHDRVTLDMGDITKFRNGSEGYVTRLRSWKATEKVAK